MAYPGQYDGPHWEGEWLGAQTPQAPGSIAATLSGSGDIAAPISATAQIGATLVGSGDFSAAINTIATPIRIVSAGGRGRPVGRPEIRVVSMHATLAGASRMGADIVAQASMSAALDGNGGISATATAVAPIVDIAEIARRRAAGNQRRAAILAALLAA